MDYKLDENYQVEEDTLGTKIAHPAFGTIAFARRTGGQSQTLFGSSIYHKDTITLTVRHADMTRGLNQDWYMGHTDIVECEMSYAQFVEAITNINVGTGIPCTLTYTEKDGRLPACKFIDKYTEFTEEMSEYLSEKNKSAEEFYDEVKNLFETKNSIGKADRKNILDKLYSLVHGTQESTKYTLKQFQEQMNKTVHEAKGEIEAFTQNKMFCIAQQALIQNREDITKQLSDTKPMDYLPDHNTENKE